MRTLTTLEQDTVTGQGFYVDYVVEEVGYDLFGNIVVTQSYRSEYMITTEECVDLMLGTAIAGFIMGGLLFSMASS